MELSKNPEEITARESSRDAAILTGNFHGLLKDESAQEFLCRFAESARGFTPEQIVRIGNVADSGEPGGMTALAREYGRSMLDVVAVARDFGGPDKDTP